MTDKKHVRIDDLELGAVTRLNEDETRKISGGLTPWHLGDVSLAKFGKGSYNLESTGSVR